MNKIKSTGTPGADGAPGAAGPPGPTTNEFWLSPVDQMVTGTAPAEAAGSFTTGCSFVPTRSCTVTGVRFYKAGGTSRTYRAVLWNNAGTVLQSKDVATTAAGLYTAVFDTPQVIAQEAGGTARYKVSIWETTGTVYTRIGSNTPCYMPSTSAGLPLPFLCGRSTLIVHPGAFGVGNTNPTTEAANERYPVEPVVT